MPRSESAQIEQNLYRKDQQALLDPNPSSTFLSAVSVVCFISALFAAYFTKGKHLSWIVFLVISGLTFSAI